MTPTEFQTSASSLAIDMTLARTLALAYRSEIPEKVLALCQMAPDGDFFEGKFCRKLSVREILHATGDLHVDFVRTGFLPLFDCGDNDFIVYRFSDGKWLKFNIVDEITFRESDDWKSLI